MHQRRWTEAEIDRGIAMRETGATWDAIALVLGRHAGGVEWKLRPLVESIDGRVRLVDPATWARFEHTFAGVRFDDAAERRFTPPPPRAVGADWLRA